MVTPNEKGTALELAVRAIELAILRTSPGYSQKTFFIESNKIIDTDSVHHEIDIWVRVDLSNGYDAVFIFECKNRQEKVSKNDIIVFAEKIHAARAQTGFFVARSFTRDAVARAAMEPRIQLLYVSELPTADVPVPLGFHAIRVEQPTGSVNLKAENLPDGMTETAIDFTVSNSTLDGQTLLLSSYLGDWINAEARQRTSAFRSEMAPEGLHSLPFKAERDFGDRQLVVNGKRILRMTLNGQICLRVLRARVTSVFELQNRGRAVHVSVEMPDASIAAVFACQTPIDPNT